MPTSLYPLLDTLQLFYDTEACLLICTQESCKFALSNSPSQVVAHLRDKHNVPTEARKGLHRLLKSLSPTLLDPNKAPLPADGSACHDKLQVNEGFACLDCPFRTINIQLMRRHQWILKLLVFLDTLTQNLATPWTLSSYRQAALALPKRYLTKGLIDYFVVEEEEGRLFGDLKADAIQASRDLDNRAEIVQHVDESRADRVPWLVRTGFATYLRGLYDSEILSSYALPHSVVDTGRCNKDDNTGTHIGTDVDADDYVVDTSVDLSRILSAADGGTNAVLL
ncbi:hypothetical protein FOTG_16424 [Fusarium oxysporum f. sp. vasinfectum 25433]|uniref:Uncharacterized protein n=1 Tax=Fusarium oxysporum f. sp. vasinfectum 25433 TaxID=1089449 RepID=X0KNL2_FUSOX|nr:hypothetical protein FOTG_16424 [Fusarium oxysporum f. sp. vasinfectum 25433]